MTCVPDLMLCALLRQVCMQTPTLLIWALLVSVPMKCAYLGMAFLCLNIWQTQSLTSPLAFSAPYPRLRRLSRIYNHTTKWSWTYSTPALAWRSSTQQLQFPLWLLQSLQQHKHNNLFQAHHRQDRPEFPSPVKTGFLSSSEVIRSTVNLPTPPTSQVQHQRTSLLLETTQISPNLRRLLHPVINEPEILADTTSLRTHIPPLQTSTACTPTRSSRTQRSWTSITRSHQHREHLRPSSLHQRSYRCVRAVLVHLLVLHTCCFWATHSIPLQMYQQSDRIEDLYASQPPPLPKPSADALPMLHRGVTVRLEEGNPRLLTTATSRDAEVFFKQPSYTFNGVSTKLDSTLPLPLATSGHAAPNATTRAVEDNAFDIEELKEQNVEIKLANETLMTQLAKISSRFSSCLRALIYIFRPLLHVLRSLKRQRPTCGYATYLAHLSRPVAIPPTRTFFEWCQSA